MSKLIGLIEPGLVEPIPVFDQFCCGLAGLEEVGPCVRLLWCNNQTHCETGEPMRVLCRKLVLPYDAVVQASSMMRAFAVRRRAVATTENVVRLRG